MADQGGIKLGYEVLQRSLQRRDQSAPVGGYTERQQYWIAYAQSQCAVSVPEAVIEELATDPHPPAEFRVNGVLMNRPEFAQDFACGAGYTNVSD